MHSGAKRDVLLSPGETGQQRAPIWLRARRPCVPAWTRLHARWMSAPRVQSPVQSAVALYSRGVS